MSVTLDPIMPFEPTQGRIGVPLLTPLETRTDNVAADALNHYEAAKNVLLDRSFSSQVDPRGVEKVRSAAAATLLTGIEKEEIPLDLALLNLFNDQTKFYDDRIRKYIETQNENNEKIKVLQQLEQALRSNSNDIDWSNDPVKQKLLNNCKEYGLVVKDGQYIFTKEEKESLLLNVKTTMDGFMSSNDETKMYMQWMVNKKEAAVGLVTSLQKKFHDMVMRVVDNIGH